MPFGKLLSEVRQNYFHFRIFVTIPHEILIVYFIVTLLQSAYPQLHKTTGFPPITSILGTYLENIDKQRSKHKY